jgi:hypothetical protein
MAERDSLVWVVAGIAAAYILSRNASAQGCSNGDTKVVTCSDGNVITTHTCTGDQWVATGNACSGSSVCSVSIGGYEVN